MISRKTPCQFCTERYPGCHGVCEKYAAMKEQREEIRSVRNEVLDKEKGIHVPYQRERKRRRYP